MTTCRELIDLLMNYVDGELPSERREVFETHLSVCGPCRRYLESYKTTVRLGKMALAPVDEPQPPSVPESVIKAILDARQRPA
jgi:anti-sigma factor RsiW